MDTTTKHAGWRWLEAAYQHFLRVSSDKDLTDDQRDLILEGIQKIIKGRKAYEAMLRDVNQQYIEDVLEGFWESFQQSQLPDIEILEDISGIIPDPPDDDEDADNRA